MRILIIGATGYIGSAVAGALKARGHSVSGLARTPQAEAKLRALGVDPTPGDLTDLDGLRRLAPGFDGLVFTPKIPFSDEPPALEVLLAAFEGSGRPFIYTSGIGVMAIDTPLGEWREETYAEDDPFTPPPWIALRVDTENLVRAAARRGVRAMVIRPPSIWGHGGSMQIQALFEGVRATGGACYVGQGLNAYVHVHVDDLAEVFALAIERGVAGAAYHAVAGETNFRTLAEAVAKVVGCDARSISLDEARSIWGEWLGPAIFAMSGRTRCPRTRAELGWAPRHTDMLVDIWSGPYRDLHSKADSQRAVASSVNTAWTPDS